mmetsp:Transcript_58183/g.104134  ORF Transcript_58183/g.104134 Transcript_58183/m.104134 type:complete len:371 (-) Transcript_58183:50-1162(-)
MSSLKSNGLGGYVVASASEHDPHACLALSIDDACSKIAENWFEAQREGKPYELEPVMKGTPSKDAKNTQPHRGPRQASGTVVLTNPFAPADVIDNIRVKHSLTKHKVDLACVYQTTAELPSEPEDADFRTAATFADTEEGPFPKPEKATRASTETEFHMLPCWFLSEAPVHVVKEMDVKAGDKVLDLCAGPGSKALVLASQLFDPAASQAGTLLVCNEPNKQRAGILEDVLKTFLPAELLKKGGSASGSVVLTQSEADTQPPLPLSRLGPFDKILLDLPRASPNRKLGELAFNLLRCAGSLLKPGGTIVYCTTSIEDSTCEDVVRQLLRFSESYKVVPFYGTGSIEQTNGILCMAEPVGPLYMAKLTKQE